MQASSNILILTGTRGHQLRVRRLALSWRQIDLAYAANVLPEAVSIAEHDRKLPSDVLDAIESALAMGEQDALTEDAS